MTTMRAAAAEDLPDRIELEPLEQRQLRDVQVGILRTFAQFCDQRGLTYYLFAGTLLGAARHQGFIPWDDDIDVAMPRVNYDRLGQELKAAELHELILITPGTNASYPFPFAKLGRRGTLIRDLTSGGLRLPINIDIFPLDNVPGTGLHLRLRRALIVAPVRVIERALGDVLAGWKRFPDVTSRALARLVGLNRLARIVDRLSRVASKESAHVGAFVWGPGWVLPVGSFLPAVLLSFEGDLYPAPRDWSGTLTRCYGDYRLLPPMAGRVSHHTFEAFILTDPEGD